MDEINSLDEANDAVLNNDKALRIQPKAPAPTRYYFVGEDGWMKQICGHASASSVSVEKVREAVNREIPANDRLGGGGVRAVEKSEKDRYA